MRPVHECPLCKYVGMALAAHCVAHHDLVTLYQYDTDGTLPYACFCGDAFQWLEEVERHWDNHGGLAEHMLEWRLK